MLSTPSSPAPAVVARCVGVRAPGRLHLGFLDPSASLGRPFGSLGLVIDGFETAVELRPAASQHVSAADAAAQAEAPRALEHLRSLQRATGADAPLHLHLAQVLPAHAGFGSGTQLALAVGRAFATLHGLALPTVELARLLGRGLRSGVGIARPCNVAKARPTASASWVPNGRPSDAEGSRKPRCSRPGARTPTQRAATAGAVDDGMLSMDGGRAADTVGARAGGACASKARSHPRREPAPRAWRRKRAVSHPVVTASLCRSRCSVSCLGAVCGGRRRTPPQKRSRAPTMKLRSVPGATNSASRPSPVKRPLAVNSVSPSAP